MKSAKQKKRKTDLAPRTLAFPRITPQPSNTIHMSLSFASGTLSCFIFQHEVPGPPEIRGLAGGLPVLAKGGHVGGDGGVGKHQEVNAHLLVVLEPRQQAAAVDCSRRWRCSGDGWSRKWSPVRSKGYGGGAEELSLG